MGALLSIWRALEIDSCLLLKKEEDREGDRVKAYTGLPQKIIDQRSNTSILIVPKIVPILYDNQ